jgi:GDP-4-dehydro-6-deoxy-D-mannose reductase
LTGAEGFVGTHLLDHLHQHGFDVVAGVRNRARKLAYERQHYKALVCDITDAINVARVIASVRPDAVLHLAGIAQASDAATNPLHGYQSIVTAWANVLDAVRRTVPRAKVVLASAADVYGVAGNTGQPLNESTPPQPTTTFGSLKRAAETIARTFYRDFRLNVTIARPFQYTGPGHPDRFFLGAVAQRFARWDTALQGRELLLPDLNCRRDVLHVQDVVTAYERLLEEGRPDETYNICSGQAYTCREIVSAIAAEFGLDLDLRDLPAADDPAQIPVLIGDGTKLRTELHWQPTHTLAEAVRELVGTYRTSLQTAPL